MHKTTSILALLIALGVTAAGPAAADDDLPGWMKRLLVIETGASQGDDARDEDQSDDDEEEGEDEDGEDEGEDDEGGDDEGDDDEA
jgi:hypothetical protein